MMAIGTKAVLESAARRKYAACPRCGTVPEPFMGYYVHWHDEGWFMRHMDKLMGVSQCVRAGGHFDVECWTCHALLGTSAPNLPDSKQDDRAESER